MQSKSSLLLLHSRDLFSFSGPGGARWRVVAIIYFCIIIELTNWMRSAVSLSGLLGEVWAE